MFTLILRSFCVGLAFLVGAVCAGGFAFAFWASRNGPLARQGSQQEVGWDLVAMYQHGPMMIKLLPLGFFLVGFLVGYRYFSRALPDRQGG